MGISHQAILNAHPGIELVAVCDPTRYILDVIERYTGVKGYADHREMLDRVALDAVVIATPSRLHAEMVRAALDRGLNVFCEKPFCLDLDEGADLVKLAASRSLVGQVGYHYRFVAAFREAKRVIDAGALGEVHHVRAEAYGPVVLRPKGSTWRVRRTEGGGCLYDYACHAIDLVSYLVGAPSGVSGTILNSVFSNDVDDEVYATLAFPSGFTGQIAANWSDESYRKMSMKVSVWGTGGKLVADRQECQIYLRAAAPSLNLDAGWTTRYTTDLTAPVWYYLRGEEYSSQIDHFVRCVADRGIEPVSSFATAHATDRVLGMMIEDAKRPAGAGAAPASAAARARGESKGFLGGLIRRRT